MIVSRIYEWARIQPAKTAVIHNDVPLAYAAFAGAIEATRAHLETQAPPVGRTALVIANDKLDAWLLMLALRDLGLNTICVPTAAEAEQLNARDVACVAMPQAEAGLHSRNNSVFSGRMVVVAPEIQVADMHLAELPRAGGTAAPFGGHILYTSGTTGSHKKVFLDGAHEDERNAKRACTMAFRRGTIHHNLYFGLWTGAGFKQPPAAWHVGGTVVIDTRPNALDRFYRYGITSAALLPPMVKTLLELHGGPDSSPDRRVEFGIMSGFISLDLAERASRLLTDNFFIRYSATESMSILMQSQFKTKDDLHWLSIVDGQTIEVVDEAGRECAAGEEGELRIRSMDIDCISYMDDEATSARVFRNGYFYPGDLAVRREDGRIRVLGRTEDVLNVQGQKIAVAPVEDAIRGILGVEEVCVFSGLTDAGEEEVVIAIESGSKPALADLQKVAGVFSEFDRVRCTVLKAFPRNRTGTGKVQRAALKLLVSKERSTGAIAAPSA